MSVIALRKADAKGFPDRTPRNYPRSHRSILARTHKDAKSRSPNLIETVPAACHSRASSETAQKGR